MQGAAQACQDQGIAFLPIDYGDSRRIPQGGLGASEEDESSRSPPPGHRGARGHQAVVPAVVGHLDARQCRPADVQEATFLTVDKPR